MWEYVAVPSTEEDKSSSVFPNTVAWLLYSPIEKRGNDSMGRKEEEIVVSYDMVDTVYMYVLIFKLIYLLYVYECLHTHQKRASDPFTNGSSPLSYLSSPGCYLEFGARMSFGSSPRFGY